MHTQNLATLADKIPHKIRKRDAQYMLQELHEQHPEIDGGTLASLYKFFMPAIPKKPRTNWDWVARAIDTKEYRHYLRYVYVTDKEIVGTDGHRLHIVPNSDGLQPGYYLTNGDRAHDLDYAKYPDYSRVMPDLSAMQNAVVNLADSPLEESGNWVKYVLTMGDCTIKVNRRYLLEALGGKDIKNYRPTLKFTDSNSVIVYQDGDRYAAIMPCR